MDLLRFLQVTWKVLLICSLGMHVGVLAQSSVQIVFTKSPASVTNQTSADFEFTLKGDNGQDPCGECSIKCKLDAAAYQDCASRGDSYVNLVDGKHTFVVLVNISTGILSSTEYQWVVDTIPPTAAIDAGPHFTSDVNVTVDIRFSEPCTGGGGFVCSDLSNCDLFLYGAGIIIPSSLKVVIPDLEYTLVVALSNDVMSGRILLALAKGFCTDAAGNIFQRSANSSFLIHLDRGTVSVHLWTAIPETAVTINQQARTLQATNQLDELLVYLDFTEPVLNSTDDLLRSLEVNMGTLVPIQRASHGNRRFGFQLMNVSTMGILTVGIMASSVVSRAGTTIAPTSQIAFLFDNLRPIVVLTTTLQAKTKASVVPVLFQFSEPVFGFDSSDITISGGNISSFKEVSKSMYFVELLIGGDNPISVSVQENKTFDIAGNPNFASNILNLNHYSVPASSVVLYTFTSAGLLATTLASGLISVSSANLAAVGALESRTMGSINTNPSRNLLGMGAHLQTFALSSWLAVSLPVEYYETVKGLRWLVPHAKIPWEKKHVPSENDFVFESKSPLILDKKEAKRRIAEVMPPDLNLCDTDEAPDVKFDLSFSHSWRNWDDTWKHQLRRKTSVMAVASQYARNFLLSCTKSDVTSHESAGSGRLNFKERKLAYNTSMFGPPLSADEYVRYFKNQTSNVGQTLRDFKRSNTGWKNFRKSMFWLAVPTGALITVHVLLLIFLRWRTKTSLRGSLSIPRFELFLLILALPCLCQAPSFIIRGGTTAGIVVGVLLLAIPAAFFLSVTVFISIAIIMGALVQYKEIKQGTRGRSCYGKLLVIMFGRQSVGKWVRKEGLTSSFIPRFGLLFEDRKGPKKIQDMDATAGRLSPRWLGNRLDGITGARPANSDDSENVAVSKSHKLFGTARVFYITVDIVRRMTLGVAFGAYPKSDNSWSQVSLVFGVTILQLLYLIFFKPYIRRGVQCVETVSLICEAGIFASAMALLATGDPFEDHKGVGILMLLFLMVSFVFQLVNQWYALMEQLLRLSPTEDQTLKSGLKMLWRGLILPIIPRSRWSKIIEIQPQLSRAGLAPIPLQSPSPDLQRTRIQPTNSPATAGPSTVSVHDLESPSVVDPRPTAMSEKGVDEVSPAKVRRSGKQSRSPWSGLRSLERKKSKAAKGDPRTTELKLLRELAKASFPGSKRDASLTDFEGSLQVIPPVATATDTHAADRGKQVVLIKASSEPQSSTTSSDDLGGILSNVTPPYVAATRA